MYAIRSYYAYDAVKHFESINLTSPKLEDKQIPESKYLYYKYIITFDHFHNRLYLTENLLEGELSSMELVEAVLHDKRIGFHKFYPSFDETSSTTDSEYREMVSKGKQHCRRGDVFQIVLSRRFSQPFKGDEFNVYRALRNINPSPYLFYFDVITSYSIHYTKLYDARYTLNSSPLNG